MTNKYAKFYNPFEHLAIDKVIVQVLFIRHYFEAIQS